MIKDFLLDTSKLPPFIPELSFLMVVTGFFTLSADDQTVTREQLFNCELSGRLVQNRGQGQRKRKSKKSMISE